MRRSRKIERGRKALEEGSRETDPREKQLMPDGSKYQQREANVYSIECRTAGDAGSCRGLEVRRSHNAEGLIWGKSGWSVGPKIQAPLEVEVLAIERIQRRTDDLRRDVRSGGKLVTIRPGDM
jgi:hypothetical protein